MLRKLLRKARRPSSDWQRSADTMLMATGELLSRDTERKTRLTTLAEAEFKIFSQFGDDGIIQWLTGNTPNIPPTFVEFGVENYTESNTRFLLRRRNWSGLIIDGDANNIAQVKSLPEFWKHDLHAVHAFVTRENINSLLSDLPFGQSVGVLHIDIDGNDYWVYQAITAIDPVVLIVEYNSVFGSTRAITVPYTPSFDRKLAHSSHLYFGASLPAFYDLAADRGYRFVGCNEAGNNAYFIKKTAVFEGLPRPDLETGFRNSKFRESRNENGALTFLGGSERLDAISGLPVWNTRTDSMESV